MSVVQINFGAQSSQFTYDPEKKVYLKQINNEAQIDGKTGEQLAFTNVFVLETDISVRDDVGRKQIDWDGGEDSVGYYVSNGRGYRRLHGPRNLKMKNLISDFTMNPVRKYLLIEEKAI